MPNNRLSHFQNTILAHPHFDAAFLRYLVALQPFRTSDKILNRFVSSHARLYAFSSLAALHYHNETALPGGGVTFGQLLESCTMRAVCGERALRNVMILGRAIRMVRLFRGDDNRRTVYYTPTEFMLGILRHFIALTLSMWDELSETTRYGQQMADDAAFLPLLLRGTAPYYFDTNIAIVEAFPQLLSIITLEGGIQVLSAFVISAMRGQKPPGLIDISRSTFITPSNARNVMVTMQQNGMIGVERVTGAPDLSAAVHALKAVTARNLAFMLTYGLGKADTGIL